MSVLKAVISNFQRVKKKSQSNPPPPSPQQSETLGASDTFNIQEKRYWFLGLNEEAFALFFRAHPGRFDSSRVPTPVFCI